ncbi:MAG TPA: ABC transporter permease [Bryobacteraceae bacterium]|nr:ABC transporter permease [Bryobacteraceae bacterium]
MPLELMHAIRALRKSPVFAVTAVLTIALGIGASTAIFSVTNAVLLRPLPYRDPDRLVYATVDLKQRNVRDFSLSNADFFDLRRSAGEAFEDLAAVASFGSAVMPRDDGTREQIRYVTVTTNMLRLLGVGIACGRDFTDADGEPPPDPVPGGPPPPRPSAIAILSYEYFQRHFGGNTAVLGHPILGAKGGAVIVGVLARGSELLFPPGMRIDRTPDLWIAARLPYDDANRLVVSLNAVGRLKPGVSLARARAQVDAVAGELRRRTSIWQTAGFQIRLEPMHAYLVAEARPVILALMGAAVLLLLIACANVANLLLVRSSLRGRELAVRSALGAGRWRLARGVLGEALLLAICGSAAGAILAWVGVRELLAIAPATLPRAQSIAIDPMVLVFATLLGLAAAAAFGMLPALRVSRPNIADVLRSAGRTAGLGSGSRLRNVAVIAEVGLSLVLLIGSGLMFRSFLAIRRIDRGFDPHALLSFQTVGAPFAKTPQERQAYMRQMHQVLEAVPGVGGVTAVSTVPLSGGYFGPVRWGTAEALADASKFQAADELTVLPGYFELMHVPLIEGRTFREDDNAPERNGVIIDQFLAAKAFPHQSAVGKRFLLKRRKPDPEWMEVVGVVAHQRETSLAQPGREQIFEPDGFWGHEFASEWIVRTQGDPAKYAPAIRDAVAKFNRGIVIADLLPVQVWVDRAEAGTRFAMLLTAVFASMAAALAAVGLYGVLATLVRQRTAEIGLRMALGAAPAAIFQLVVGQGLRLSAAGIAAGLAAAFALTRVLNSLLVGVKATDPTTFAGIAVLFLIIAALASWLPARRAAALPPTSALRDE